jgi:hypothetical protein
MAELIKANGGRVSFKDWVEGEPRFQGAVVTRVLKKLPKEIQPFIQHSRGLPARLKIELLRAAQ